ncbi:hypothetical protein PoB_003147200 [Plakobranchus ocellatus]|uniref:C-type lectin domain-containing protein n=1 Tax=Plakobranchus ocellatus TaxID=259542 RepID=A0AAV4AD71_9GAST|nr:hypothetical protein PoB_003147200 [Plakobranchus ocellatus]
MRVFRNFSYTLESHSGQYIDAFDHSSENPSLVSFQNLDEISSDMPLGQEKDNRIDQTFAAQSDACDQPVSGRGKTEDGPKESLSVSAASGVDSANCQGFPGRAETVREDFVMEQTIPKGNQRAHPPARIAKGQEVLGEMYQSHRLTSLWPGHRPLTASVSGYLDQQQMPEENALQKDGAKNSPETPTHIGRDETQASGLTPQPATFTSPASTSDLCSHVSSCSLLIDSGLGSESTSVLGSMDHLVISDPLSLDIEQARDFTHIDMPTSGAETLFGADAVDTSSCKDEDVESSQPPSDDDSGVSGVIQDFTRRGSDSVSLVGDAKSCGEKRDLPSTGHIFGDFIKTQKDGKISKFSENLDSEKIPPSPPGNLHDVDSKTKKRTSKTTSLELSRESVCAKYTSCRWVLAYLCFLARFMQTALRQSLGIAIIGMTLKMTQRVVTPDAGWEAWETYMAQNATADGNSGSGGNTDPVFNNLVRNGSTWRWTDENGFNWTMVVSTVSSSYIELLC